MSKKTVSVNGLPTAIEQVLEVDHFSLTDIANQSGGEPRFVIQYWLKNANTISYLWAWEDFRKASYKPVHRCTTNFFDKKNAHILEWQPVDARWHCTFKNIQ